MQRFETAKAAALELRPDEPVYCFRPDVLKQDATSFMGMFPGKTAYAVKTNGEPMVLKALSEIGVNCFDVASPGEIRAVREVAPDAEMLYMHPIKAQSDIKLALEQLGVAADRALVIGDWKERDILGGRNAGLHTVYARYGDLYSQYADKVAGQGPEPDFVVDDLLQLLDVLTQLNGGTTDGKARS